MADAILAADDDRGSLLLLRTILEGQDYELVTAENGEQARALLDQNPERFVAILLDWGMPRLSGIELLRWIRAERRLDDIPVVMQTAMDTPEQIREGIDAGAFYYLTKPFDARVLLSIVSAAVADFRRKAALARMLQESQNPLRDLVDGLFRFRKLDDADRMAMWIANACPDPLTHVTIVELLYNAVEHGNLGITYDEKTRLVDRGIWHSEVERRLALPECAHKYVQVRVTKDQEEIAVLVEDQGPGFDYGKYLVFDEKRAFDNHGRGIAMTGMAMHIQYLGTGNRVRVTIPLA
jgi:DNA-binding response OmpR family regulator